MSDNDPFPVVSEEWQKLRPSIERLFAEQWADPELPAMEYRSAARLADWLSQHGFDAERSAGGIPTAFAASKGPGKGPVIAILAEYDALPGLGNLAAAGRHSTDQRAGHACGHNHIGPANTGAAIAAANALARLGLKGEIRLIGCPAEEILWGKIALHHAGIFAGVDAILTSHGDYQTGALSRPCQAVVSGEFVFLGEARHGGEVGRGNALLGAEMAVAQAKQAIAGSHPDVMLRHVLRQAGTMPSIIPGEARVWFSTRGYDFEAVRRAYVSLEKIAHAAALACALRMRHQFIAESRGYLPNDALGGLLFRIMQRVGPPRWSAEDISFMERLSAACAPESPMHLDRGIHYFDEGRDPYGQDDGELSWRIPLGRVNWAYPRQIPIHHWAWTALSGHRASHPGPLMASQTLAAVAVMLCADHRLLAEAKQERARRTADVNLSEPRLGAVKTLTTAPESFWDATWVE
jgi:aminobenzoyl-glutamate utilization protein B